MYKIPSRRKKERGLVKPNLIPILDAVFIFIFFLLMSANFHKVFEIASDVPIVSEKEPPKSKKIPLALTLKISSTGIHAYTGVPSKLSRSFDKYPDGRYDLIQLRKYLIGLKSKNVQEKGVVLEPVIDLPYEQIVNIMDSVRNLKKTDPAIFKKDKDGIEIREYELFSNIVFGNIQS